jgi:hypothetical protein
LYVSEKLQEKNFKKEVEEHDKVWLSSSNIKEI